MKTTTAMMNAGRMCPSLLLLILSALLGNAAGQAGCIKTPTQLMTAEANVDTSVVRTYTLCARTRTYLSRLDFSYDLYELGKQPPLQLRPNMHLKCGTDGNIDNGCWFYGGDIQIDASNVLGNLETLDNVVIEGVTFFGSTRYSLWANKAGSITFKNCAWKDHQRSLAPILLDYFDGSSNDALTVTFIDCEFTGNRYFGAGSNTAIIYSNGGQNILNVDRTIFSNNDMTFNNTMSATRSFVIESLGPITIRDSCFVDNKVGVANIGSFGNSIISTNDYVNQASAGGKCPYIAAYLSYQQFIDNAPLCRSFTSSVCLAKTTRPPTVAPTMSPTGGPTSGPTSSPTGSPTTTPMPTLPPVMQTPAPTDMPVAPPVDGASSAGNTSRGSIAASIAVVVFGIMQWFA